MPKGGKKQPVAARPVLVVDDDPYITEVLIYTLRREAWAVETASNGEEAIKQIRAHRPWLVFLDVCLPGKTGTEVCQAVKADPALADTYIIMLTGRGLEEEDQALARSAGADEYLTKPFSPRAIAARVKSLAQVRDGHAPQAT